MEFKELINKFQNDPYPDNRRHAVNDLIHNQMINEISIKAFANGLLDPEIGIRDICQRALSEAPDEFKPLAASSISSYITVPDIELRNLAGDILIKLGSASVSTLLPFLKDKDHDVRKFACDILGLVADASIADNILPLLTDSDKNVQIAGVEALGNIQAESALDQLIMIYENFEEIKPSVIEAIGKIGGNISEDYLLEKLSSENNQFLQIAIIDALAFNAKHISISYNLLERMESSHPEMQKIMLMTAFAIAFRLGEPLIMPDNLRFVAHRAMLEDDENIRMAGLIALGDKYGKEDFDALIAVIGKNIEDANQNIIYNITANSEAAIINEFFNMFFEWENTAHIQTDFLENITLCWDSIPLPNKDAVINTLLINFELTDAKHILHTLSALKLKDSDYITNKLRQYSLETSIENKQKMEALLEN